MDNPGLNTELKNYKFKELKVYSSTEWLADNKKKYRQVFDRYETSYIYAELSFYNKLFDRDSWDVDVELRCYEIRSVKRQVCNLTFRKKINKFDNIVYIREGWGNKREGSFWKKGTYYWEAWIDGEKVSTKYFYVEDVGKVDELSENPYIRLTSLKLYEGHYDDVMEEERVYMSAFSGEESRYIYAELGLKNNFRSDNWHCELFVKFYNEARELKGQVVRLQNIKKEEEYLKVSAGWGANVKGSWKPGQYSVEIVFMDKLLAVVYFHVGENFEEGVPVVTLKGAGEGELTGKDENNASFLDVYEELQQLIGLKEIKKKVLEHAMYIDFLKLRKGKGFKESEKINIHSVFTGNPGTGKTTVARMMGMLYKKMGLLSKGHVTEVDRVDLVGEYIGQTAPKVREVIEKARGGVLFIDEAYALARTNDDSKDFGREVIEILMKEMSNGKGDLAVIVAGYPKEMKHFITSNPGLKSRFKHYFEFPDYLPQELTEIARFFALQKEVKFTPEAFDLLKDMITSAYRDRDRTFGNARFVNDLIEKSKINMAIRLMARKHPSRLTVQELGEIQLQDVRLIQSESGRILPDIPLDAALLDDALAELHALIGIENVKKQISDFVNIVRYYRASGKNVISNFSLHTVFVGNPGTGKTTVARILTKIYKALGILERGQMIETDRQGLVAGFVGQTAIKTAERIDEALGGVLFIDEAYALSNFNGLQGDFGNEAIQTLLKRMEDLRGQFFVFVAGYPDNMEVFLKANPGLQSRFDKVLKFEDYNPVQMEEIAKKMFRDEGFRVAKKGEMFLHEYFKSIYITRDKYFGNARTIRKIVTEAIKNQNLRLSDLAPGERKKGQANLINYEDLAPIAGMQEEETFRKKTIGYRSGDR